MRRWTVRAIARTIVVAAVLSGTAAVTTTASAGQRGANALAGLGSSSSMPASAVPPAFTIRGSVGGLYPGSARQLTLALTNNKNFAIVVTSVSTQVGDASATCVAANLSVAQFVGHLTIAGGRTGNVVVSVLMSHGAPDACQGATFPMQYTGLAEKA